MANLYGANYTKSERTVPVEILPHAEVNGKVHVAYDSITLAGVVANGDVIYMSKIPAGARVLSVKIASPSLGTTGTANVGTLTDATAFGSAVSFNGGAVAKNLPSLEKFTAEEQLVLTFTAATTLGAGLTVQVAVEFIVA